MKAASWAAAALLLALAAPAAAEPHFLAKQYARCTTCHYAPSGGGLLTEYGRSLSRQELSTWGRSPEGQEAAPDRAREEEFLFGALHGRLGNLALGADLRPSRLDLDLGSFQDTRDFWMRADFQAAYRANGWTAYAELGRLPEGDEASFISREHWIGYESESGLGLRAGRFMPAFGLRLADHTSYNRRDLGFDQDDQIWGLELSQTNEASLYQFSIGPGRAESFLDDDGSDAWTATARAQWELAARHVLVLSGMYRGESRFQDPSFFGSVAYGWAPSDRLTLWTELDERVAEGWGGTPAYTVVHEASLEVFRGLWLKFSPQIRTELGDVGTGATRLALGAHFMPRTHWHLNLTWFRDRDRASGFVAKTLLLQLHLYL